MDDSYALQPWQPRPSSAAAPPLRGHSWRDGTLFDDSAPGPGAIGPLVRRGDYPASPPRAASPRRPWGYPSNPSFRYDEHPTNDEFQEFCTCDEAGHEKLLSDHRAYNRVIGHIAAGLKPIGVLFFVLSIYYSTVHWDATSGNDVVNNCRRGLFFGVAGVSCFGFLTFFGGRAMAKFKHLTTFHQMKIENTWPEMSLSIWFDAVLLMVGVIFICISGVRWGKAHETAIALGRIANKTPVAHPTGAKVAATTILKNVVSQL